MKTTPRFRRRFAAAALTAVALALAYAARAQLMTGASLVLQFPFFAAGGGRGTLSGGTISLAHSIGEGAITSMSGGTLSLTPGVLGMQPAAAANASFVHAFPVPFKPPLGHDRITFRGLTSNATVKVYSLSGQLVQTLTKSDPTTADLVWLPVVNSAGQPLASGVYFYSVVGDSGRASGKLMIIR